MIIIQDESKYTGEADAVYTPETVEELKEIIRTAKKEGKKLTPHGSLTGITGAGVPCGSCALDMTHLKRVEIYAKNNEWFVRMQSGITGDEAEGYIRQKTKNEMFLPVFPTEKTATLGGIAATGARGIHFWKYGKLIDYVDGMTVIEADGEEKYLRRNEKGFLDYFRSEGMYGVIVSLEIRLITKPRYWWGILFQFVKKDSASDFAEKISGMKEIIALEYLDNRTIRLIEKYKKNLESISELPDIENDIYSAVYVEIAGDSEESLMEQAEILLERCLELEEYPERAWAVCTEEEIERLRAYRHAASECVNMEIALSHGKDERIYKLSLDIQKDLKDRKKILKVYENIFESCGIQYCIFGHWGTGGPYVNMIPKDYEQYQKGLYIFETVIKKAYAEGAEVFYEHGVGKVKKQLFLKCAPDRLQKEMECIKGIKDEDGFWNPQNMISEKI